MSSRPTENFAEIMRFVRFITSCVGVDVYDKNFRFNKITAVVVTFIFIYITCTIITMINENNWMFTVQAIVMGGSAIQGCNKLIVGISSPRKVYEVNHHVFEIYAEYEQQPDPRFAEALLQSCHRLRRALLIVGISYLVGVTGMVFTPLVATKLTGKLNLAMHFHLPGVDVNTEVGAWITQGAHVICLIIGGLGLYAGDLAIVVHLLQSFVFADVLRLKVDIFNRYVEDPEDNQSESYIVKVLVDIAQFHQIYLKFIVHCNELFYSIVSVQIATAALCIVITLFVLVTSEWPGGYCFVIVLIPNLYIYCILGTLLEVCNDNIMYEVYNISFYNLNVRQQRLVWFMLCKSQRSEVIVLLGVMPLAVSTALKV
ncbi:hypothetical protein ACLKA7_011438 [Drosophila subpalustris]